MHRTVFDEDHESFRKMIRDFIAKEVVPAYPEWEAQGHPPREFYRRLGELGVLGIQVPEQYGGGGAASFTYALVIAEETAAAGVSFGSYSVHSNLILPYLMSYANEEQKQRWVPSFATGELMFAIAMTEPGTGSDLANIATTARLSDDGSHLRPRWVEDVHHRRCTGRPGPRRVPDLAVVAAGPARRADHPRRRRRRRGVLRRPQAGQDRAQGVGHRRAGVRFRAGAGRGPASARRVPGSPTSPTTWPRSA